jgi:hypothetical protein
MIDKQVILTMLDEILERMEKTVIKVELLKEKLK